MTTLLLVALTIMVLANPIRVWLKEKRLRKLAEHRLRIAKAVTEAEKLMLSGDLRQGQVCHDKVFRFMLCAEFIERFPAPQFPVALTKDQILFRQKLKDELRDGGSTFAIPLTRFLHSFYAGFHLDRPVLSKVYMLMLATYYFLLRSQLEWMKTKQVFLVALKTINEVEAQKRRGKSNSERIQVVLNSATVEQRSFSRFSATTFAVSTSRNVMEDHAVPA